MDTPVEWQRDLRSQVVVVEHSPLAASASYCQVVAASAPYCLVVAASVEDTLVAAELVGNLVRPLRPAEESRNPVVAAPFFKARIKIIVRDS